MKKIQIVFLQVQYLTIKIYQKKKKKKVVENRHKVKIWSWAVRRSE